MDVGHEGKPVEGVTIRLFRQTEKATDVLRKRFALTQDSDSDPDDVSCSYYIGDGRLSSGNCTTLLPITDEYVDCACTHFSNFGLLFGNDSNEDWTVWRILSVALWLGMWVFMITLYLLMKWATFRVTFGLETQSEKMNRVLGHEDETVDLG